MGVAIAYMLLQAHLEQEKHRQKLLAEATPERRKALLEKWEKERQEAIIERRHYEQIRAQEKIAEAIRYAAIMRL